MEPSRCAYLIRELDRSNLTPGDDHENQPPIYGITRWHVATIALLAFGYSAYYFCRSDYSVALPLMLAEQVRHGANPQIAEIRLGTIASLGVFAYALGKVPAGAMADRFGGRGNFLGGMAGSSLFTLLFIAAGGFPLFTLAWIGNRLVQSMGWAGLVKIASRWFSYSTYGSVMAILSLSYLFGDALSREAMSLLLDHGMSWRGIFATGAALLAGLLLLNLVFLRESPTHYGLEPATENPKSLFSHADGEPGEKHVQPGTVVIFRGLLSSDVFWLVCALSLGTTLLRETFNLWTPTYFMQFAGMTSAQAARGSALFPLFGGLSVLGAGFLSDLVGAVGRSRITFGGLSLTAGALAALAFVPAHAPQWLPLSLVGGVAFLLIGPYSYLAGAMSLDFGGKAGGATASGIIDSVGYLAAVLSGNGVAYVVVTLGWKTSFLVLALVAALSSVAAITLIVRQMRLDRAVLSGVGETVAAFSDRA